MPAVNCWKALSISPCRISVCCPYVLYILTNFWRANSSSLIVSIIARTSRLDLSILAKSDADILFSFRARSATSPWITSPILYDTLTICCMCRLISCRICMIMSWRLTFISFIRQATWPISSSDMTGTVIVRSPSAIFFVASTMPSIGDTMSLVNRKRAPMMLTDTTTRRSIIRLRRFVIGANTYR